MSCLLFACQCSRHSLERQRRVYIRRAERVKPCDDFAGFSQLKRVATGLTQGVHQAPLAHQPRMKSSTEGSRVTSRNG